MISILDTINSSTFQKKKMKYALAAKSITTLNERPLLYNFASEISLIESIHQTFTTVQIYQHDTTAIISELEPEHDIYSNIFEMSIPLVVQKSFFVKAKVKAISKFASKPFID